MPVDPLAEVLAAPEPGGVAAPVRPAVAHQLGPEGVNVGREVLHGRLGHRHEDRAEVLRVLHADVPHDLLVEDVVQVGREEVPPPLPLGVLERRLLVAVAVRKLLELLVDRRDAARDESHELLEGPAVGELGVVPRELLDVPARRHAAHGEVPALLASELGRALLDLAYDRLDDRVGLAEVVAEVHERVERPDHEAGDLELEHLPVRRGRARRGVLELPVRGLRRLAGVRYRHYLVVRVRHGETSLFV